MLSDYVENFSGKTNEKCRLLIGLQSSPKEDLRKYKKLIENNELEEIDQRQVIELKKKIVHDFKVKLESVCPSNKKEESLNKLVQQIEDNKLEIKLYLEHPDVKIY